MLSTTSCRGKHDHLLQLELLRNGSAQLGLYISGQKEITDTSLLSILLSICIPIFSDATRVTLLNISTCFLHSILQRFSVYALVYTLNH